MNRLLHRQLKRWLGIADEDGQAAAIGQLRSLADQFEKDDSRHRALRGLGEFLAAVDEAYTQDQRDLELRARSLELSSAELGAANEQLREKAASQARIIDHLRHAANGLLTSMGRAPLDPDSGDIEQLLSLMTGLVREREKAQDALQTALHHLENQKFALDQHAIVSITDTAGAIVYANDRFCALSGYSRGELLGQNHRIVNSGLHPPEFFAGMWATIGSGRVWHGEICNRAKGGRLYWVAATIVPLLDAHGKPSRYVAIRTDISQRKEIEQRLEDQLHFSQQLIAATPIPLYFKDTDGRYLGANRAFAALFGVDVEWLLGRTVHDLLPPATADFHDQYDRELFAGIGAQSYEVDARMPDRRHLTLLYHKATLTRPDGSVRGLIGAIIDITQRKEWEDGLLAAKEAAEAASRTKGEFLANMSHEIRTPMNGIIGLTEIVLDGELAPEQRAQLVAVHNSALDLLAIINDILDFSKIESGKLSIEETVFDPVAEIELALKPLRPAADRKGLRLNVHVRENTPTAVIGDPVRLRQVLGNLASNAVKFTDRGEVEVRLDFDNPAEGSVRLHYSVRDTGIGIPPGKQEEIFDAFSQGDASTTRRFGGTGLGLAICRRLMALMGGSIRLESEPGKGSLFSFSLQLPLAVPVVSASHAGATAAAGRTHCILLAEANPINQKLAVAILTRGGHRVVVAGNGVEAVAMSANPDVDLVLMDMQIPGMSGLEAAAAIRARGSAPGARRLPIIALTDGAMTDERERCLAAGVDAYLAKPIRSDELQSIIRQWGGES